MKNRDIKIECDYIMKQYYKDEIEFKHPKRTKVFIINGQKKSGKSTFIELCSRFTRCKEISSIDPIRAMGKLVGLEDNRHFLHDCKKLVNKHTVYLDLYVQKEIEQNCINFINIREENIIFSKKYKNYDTILMVNPNNRFDDNDLCNADKMVKNLNIYTHTIVNNNIEDLPYKAYAFIGIYV